LSVKLNGRLIGCEWDMYFTDPGDCVERPHYFAEATTTDHSLYFQFSCWHSDTPFLITEQLTHRLELIDPVADHLDHHQDGHAQE